MIGDDLLNYTLLCDYRESPGEFWIMATAYVADMNKENVRYIYNRSYRQVWPPHDAEYILSQSCMHWSRDWVLDRIGPVLGINRRKGLD